MSREHVQKIPVAMRLAHHVLATRRVQREAVILKLNAGPRVARSTAAAESMRATRGPQQSSVASGHSFLRSHGVFGVLFSGVLAEVFSVLRVSGNNTATATRGPAGHRRARPQSSRGLIQGMLCFAHPALAAVFAVIADAKRSPQVPLALRPICPPAILPACPRSHFRCLEQTARNKCALSCPTLALQRRAPSHIDTGRVWPHPCFFFLSRPLLLLLPHLFLSQPLLLPPLSILLLLSETLCLPVWRRRRRRRLGRRRCRTNGFLVS